MKSLGSKLWEVEDEDDENAAHAELGAVRAREGGWGEQRPAPGEKILVKNGEKILVKNGEKILVKNGENILVKNGEKILVKQI